MKAKTTLMVPLLAGLLIGLSGCGSQSSTLTQSSSPASSPQVTVSITPGAATVDQSGTKQFTAAIFGSANTGVTWSVKEAGGGAINSSGLYYAPTTAGTYHVIATSTADASQTASAAVTVPSVQVQITPGATTIGPGTTQTFSSTVLGTVNHTVNWTVQEGSAGGTISAAGLYSAPAVFGTYHVVATSDADHTKTAVAATTIAEISVALYPPKDTLGTSGQRQFTAVLTASSSAGVHWWMYEGVAGGLLDEFGVYTASQQLGTYHVIASSVADTSQTGSASVDVVSSGFRKTGNLSTARTAARATLLADGRVLITGGQLLQPDYCDVGSTTVVTGTSEIYDSSLGSFTPAGAMLNGRLWHSATLLADGRVLVTGGSNGTNSLSTAEVFDVASNGFTMTGPMSFARQGHTATRLQNGKVLITGGANGSAVATAEIFDPANGTFTTAGNMSVARSFHTATLLPNGSVLIVGGDGVQSAEVYDPTTGAFTPTGSMGTKRSRHTATLLADGVHVLIAGGTNGADTLATTETYNIATGAFAPTGSMLFARAEHSGSLLSNGLVLVAGGDASTTLNTAELYDPISGVFTQTGGLAAARTAHAAAVLKDGLTVLVAGGALVDSGQPVAISTAEIFR